MAFIKIRQLFGVEFYIKDSELILAFFVSSIAGWYILRRSGNRKRAIIACFIVGICIFCAIARMTVYFTVDEERAFNEQIYLASDIMRHWQLNNAQTNYLIMGSIWSVLPDFIVENLSISVGQFSKVLHWLAGFFATQIIIWIIDKKLTLKSIICREYKLILIYGVIYTLPVFKMAMKNYNYDLFSMLFSILSILLIWVMIKEKNYGYGMVAIISGALAVQEKIIAAPVVLIAEVFLAAYLMGNTKHQKGVYKVLNKLRICSLMLGIEAFAYFFTKWWVMDILRGGRSIAIPWFRTIRPVIRASEVLVQKSGLLQTLEVEWLVVIELIVQVLLVAFLAELVNFTLLIIKNKRIYRLCVQFSGVILFLGVIIGIWGNFIINDFYKENGNILKYLFIYVSTIVGSITTIGLVLLIIVSILLIRNKIDIDYAVVGILYTLLGNAFIYMINDFGSMLGTPRYVNLFVLGNQLLSLILLLNLNVKIVYMEVRMRAISFVASGLMVLETIWGIPFADTIFYPFWNINIYKNEVSGGWGSVISAAGEKIIKYSKEENLNLNEIEIFSLYHGFWPDNEYNISIVTLGSGKGRFEIPEEMLPEFEKNEFLVYDNYGVKKKLYTGITELPVDDILPPICYLTYRGAIVARIYQGNQFSDASITR